MRFPNEIFDKITSDAKALRRSKASIVVEILENHYQNGKPTSKKKLAGQR
jgi:predicted transcriptional regulator